MDNYHNTKQVVVSNIKYYREKANITEKELSKMLGKNEKFIEKLEAGLYSRAITILLLDEIAHILNVPVIRLFERNIN